MRDTREDQQSHLVNSQLNIDMWMCPAKLFSDQQNWAGDSEAAEQR
jgi:hypothetical protein